MKTRNLKAPTVTLRVGPFMRMAGLRMTGLRMAGLLMAGLFITAGCSKKASAPLNLFDQAWWAVPDESGVTSLLTASPYFAKRKWLVTEMSSWFEEMRYQEPGVEAGDARLLGYYGIGNGRTFGFVGTNYPRNTLHGLLGPDYQKKTQGFFSDFRAHLEQDGNLLPWSRDYIWKVREAQIILTRMMMQGTPLELDTIAFAPISPNPGMEKGTIIQLVNVRNGGRSAAKDLVLKIQSYANADKQDETGVYLEQVRDHHRLRVRPATQLNWTVVPFGKHGYPALATKAFELAAGEERQFMMVYEFVPASDTPGPGREAALAKGFETLLTETADWWRAWHRTGLSIKTPDHRVNDLIEGLKGTIRVQISANGAISPMSHYTGMWNRDSFAPVRTLLKFGYPDEAWGIMNYYFKAASTRGGIGNSLNTDVEIAEPLPQPDWYGNMPFSGRLRGETPSYITLMHTYFWQYTGKYEELTNRWDYLMHTLKGQGITATTGEEGLMYFSGDETFRPALSANLELPGGANYKFEDLCYSANTAFLFVKACEHLAAFAVNRGIQSTDRAWLTEKANLVRQATEKWYWLADKNRYSPFIVMENMTAEARPAEDVNTKPIWIQYLDSDSSQARSNMLSTIEAIGQDNGILQNVPVQPVSLLGYDLGGGLMTGMSPAYFLFNVAELNLSTAEKTFDTVGAYVSPSGNIHEVATFSQPGVAFSPLYFSGGAVGELYARYRPWEGAILAESLMNYLLGYKADVAKGWLKLAPRLAHGSAWLEADGLSFAGHRLKLRLEQAGNVLGCTINSIDDPTTFGLASYQLRLTIKAGTVNQVRLDDNILPASQYEVVAPFPGAREIRINVPARQGERVIKIFSG